VPLSILRGRCAEPTVQVPTLSGERRRFGCGRDTAHGTVQRLRGEGPPKLGSSERERARGDIRYRFVIDRSERTVKGGREQRGRGLR